MNAAILRTLLPSARRLVTPELCSGQLEGYDEASCETFLKPCEPEIRLEALDELARLAIEQFAPGDTEMDAWIAVRVHKALPLSRRQAADPGVFRYLTVVRYPALTRHRWEYRSFATAHGRFWKQGTRHDANVLSRWWWIAELTREGDDYSLTEQTLGRSALSTHLFSRDLCSHRPAVAAIVSGLAGAPGPRIVAALENLGKLLSVRVPEALTEQDWKQLVERALALV